MEKNKLIELRSSRKNITSVSQCCRSTHCSSASSRIIVNISLRTWDNPPWNWREPVLSSVLFLAVTWTSFESEDSFSFFDFAVDVEAMGSTESGGGPSSDSDSSPPEVWVRLDCLERTSRYVREGRSWCVWEMGCRCRCPGHQAGETKRQIQMFALHTISHHAQHIVTSLDDLFASESDII